MTDLIESILESMAKKFNAATSDLQLNLHEDKTLKWRGLHNNQYAAVKKRKDIKRNERAASTNDPSPLLNDSSSSASVNVNADDVVTSDATQSYECDSIAGSSEKSMTNASVSDHTKSADKMEKTNIDKEKDDDQRPSFRRTLRRKHNADDTNDDVNVVSTDKNRKLGLRPKRQSSAGSASENRSVSPRGEKEDKMSNDEKSTAITNRSNMTTRQRGRARKPDRENSVEIQSKSAADESNDSVSKTRNERKNSIANEVDDGIITTQPPPPKLRRSERMHTSTPSDQKDLIVSNSSDADATEHKPNDKEPITRSRKRTFDDKKSHEADVNDEKCFDQKLVPSKMDVDAKDEKQPQIEEKNENSQKNDVIVVIDVAQDTNNDDQLSNGSDANAIARKRGRKPGIAKGKANLKLNMTISTRNSPVKKSPKQTDESPFIYTIPKKDKAAVEQVMQIFNRSSVNNFTDRFLSIIILFYFVQPIFWQVIFFIQFFKKSVRY